MMKMRRGHTDSKMRVPTDRAGIEKRNETMNGGKAQDVAKATLRLITTRAARSGLPVITIGLADAVTGVYLETVLYYRGIQATSRSAHTRDRITMIRSAVNITPGGRDALLRLRHPLPVRSPTPANLSQISSQEAETLRIQNVARNLRTLTPIP